MTRNVKKGFTLIELLVVVAIISILMAILLPSLGRARAQAGQVACLARQKQLGQVMLMYAQEYNNTLVRARPTYNGANTDWHVLIAKTMITNRGASANGWDEKWHFCSVAGPDGRNNWISYNGFLGHNYDVQTTYGKYVDLKVTSIPQPGETAMFADGYFYYPQSAATTNQHLVFEGIRLDAFNNPAGTGRINADKHMGGGNYAFVDGHGEWLNKKEAARRADNPSGAWNDYNWAPFIRPFN